ncbi:hypothetical protein [Marilutibacter spongiae]|uniref:Uncharacterized protein n=1 Tax=Marilutibacter spongiae TaxID=2025720 RepID=A0A7W3Y799_9GAMM|nr:hypothetical protein [Lysobacter spongiae]MBB1061860.1 hypothetical protein [Lysobacter spongiae]
MNAPNLAGRACLCRACGEYFSRERAFDRHRTGDYAAPGQWQGNRRCLTEAEMTERGWHRNAARCWTMETLDLAGRNRVRPADGSTANSVAKKGNGSVYVQRPATYWPFANQRGDQDEAA